MQLAAAKLRATMSHFAPTVSMGTAIPQPQH